jgi:hypothetical protein
LRRILKAKVFDGNTVVLPREPMNCLIEMARSKGFVVEVQGG